MDDPIKCVDAEVELLFEKMCRILKDKVYVVTHRFVLLKNADRTTNHLEKVGAQGTPIIENWNLFLPSILPESEEMRKIISYTFWPSNFRFI
jgi:hypothetical protein